MSKRMKYSAEEKYCIMMEYLEGVKPISELAKLYKISITTIRSWQYKYEKRGILGLNEYSTYKQYSKEIKEQAVKDFLSGLYSKGAIIRKYDISSLRVLTKWINKYNSHIELKDTGKGMSAIMTKGRDTTWKERIEIAEFCIANKLDYQKTAQQYKVSYSQAYTWVKKYKDNGKDALKDKRGRKKTKEELSHEEQIKLQMKKLEAENQRLKAENLLLKKLDELERRRS